MLRLLIEYILLGVTQRDFITLGISTSRTLLAESPIIEDAHVGQMCLFENCKTDQDRHGFVTSSRIPGPNVFLDCEMTNAYSVVGPHHRWATGLLYDCCPCGIRLEVNDRAHYGGGHGWPAVNCVFWNCTADKIDCMSPWIGGKNYSIGCIGEIYQKLNYKDGLKRPDAVWMSIGQHVEPKSLYRYQLSNRLNHRLEGSEVIFQPCKGLNRIL